MKIIREVVIMANPVSTLKWSDIITEFAGLRGGARWYTDYYAAGITNEYVDAIWKTLDCSDFDESQHTTTTGSPSATPYDKIIATFANNVQLVLSLSYYNGGGGVPNHVRGNLRFKYNGSYHDQHIPSGGVNGSVIDPAGNTYTTPALIRTYGIKYSFLTYYTGSSVQQAGGVLEGVTEADHISITFLMPFTRNDVIQSWAHIHDGTMCLSDRDDPTLAYTEPNGFYYPNIPNGPSFVSDTMRYTDFDTLISDIQSLNTSITVDEDDIIKKGNKDNPAGEDDPSNPGGGGGTYDDTSDPIDYPALPTGGAISTGSIKSFLVDETRVKAVFRRLWNSSLFDVVTWQKLIEEPLDAIVSLVVLPCTPTSSGSGHIQLGNIDTEVTAPIITNQYLTIDCGSLTLKEFFGTAMDYSPYVKVDCYLPFIGIRPLKPEDVINQTVGIKYNMDILTGDLSASIKCGQSVLYKFQGNCKATVPLTSRIFSALEALMKGAGSVASSYATGAMTASAKEGATPETVHTAAGNAAAGAAINSAINVAMSKVQIQRSGDVSGSVGLLEEFVPYLIIHRPQQSLAKDFKQFKGYPSNISATLNSLSGYTEVEYIHLTGISGATDTELNEIESMLKSGVII